MPVREVSFMNKFLISRLGIQGWIWMILAVAFFFPIQGCFKPAGKVIRVTTWLGEPHFHLLADTVKDFEKQHPGYQVRLEYVPYTSYEEKITSEMAAGTTPDILMLAVNNYVDLQLRGVLTDLTDFAQKDGMDLKNDYPGVVKRFSPGGRLYVLPQDTSPMGLVYYNRKAFREAGLPYPKADWSWPEPFLSICQKLMKKDASGKVTRWAFCDSWITNCDNFLFSSGGNFVDDTEHPTRLALDTPEAIRGFQFYWDLMHKYRVVPAPAAIQSFGIGNSVAAMFMNGTVAMMDSGLWETPNFLKTKGLDFDVVSFPAGPTGLRRWATGGAGFAIAATCKDKALAWEVVKILCSETAVAQLAETGWVLPADRKLAASDAFLKSPGAPSKAILLDMPDHSVYEPFLKNWSEIYYGNVNAAMDKAWEGKQTPSEILPGLTKEINKKFFNQK